MYKPKFNRNQVFGKWKLHDFINAGGNGEVWSAVHIEDSTQIVAIKLLKKLHYKRYIRFKDEVKVIKNNNDIKGLLQIIDYSLPENVKGITPWYTMPLATQLKKYVRGKTPEQIIDLIISVSNTLAILHSRGISHRDIKPTNILVIGNEIFLSDFGLVEYPDKKDITLKWEDLGPRWTIAPEMKRDPDKADGKLTDVYSLAKTLWILLTNVQNGFEGQYSTNSSVEIKKYLPSIYHASLDNLLHKSTDHTPVERPNIQQFLDELVSWKELNRDFEKRSKSEWSDLQNKLFPTASPKTVIWDNINDIMVVLNMISAYDQVNHTLFPDGGGLDLMGAKLSCEEGCLELNFNSQAYIVKPKRLIYECFTDNSDWNYFMLETGELELIGKYETELLKEGFTEIEPCLYSDYECFEFDDFNGNRLPASARVVIRVMHGSFNICLRTGIYNSIPATYDGRHNKMNSDDFRKYIEYGIEGVEKSQKQSAKNEESMPIPTNKPKYVKSTKKRKGSRSLNADDIRKINKVISLFQEAKKEENKLMQDLGLRSDVINIFDDDNIEALDKYDRTPKPSRVDFKKHLKTLSDDDLAIVEAVMYGGRDALSIGRAHPLDEMLHQFKEDSKESRYFAVSQKDSLDDYLEAGIKEYQ